MPRVRSTKIVNNVTLYQCSKCKRFLPEQMYFKKATAKTGLTSQCRECITEYDATRLEIRREYMAGYRENHRESIRESSRRWDRKNTEKIREYAAKHKEKRKKYLKDWYTEHYKKPEAKQKYRHNTLKRRSIQKKVPTTLTLGEWDECLEYFDYKDAYTGLPMEKISRDHVIPLSKGGGLTRQNIVPCETSINESKQCRVMEEWYREQPFFSESRLKKIHKWIGYDPEKNIQQIALY